MRFLLTVAALCLFGCQTSPSVQKDPPPGSGEVLLSLQRTPCFGTCPVYLVEVLGDGTLHFRGERHVKVTEPIDTKLDPATLKKLIARVEGTPFASWPNFVKETSSDAPTVVLTFKGHTVRHYRGDLEAPEELTKLEDELDALLGTQRWTRGEGTETK